MSHYRASGSDSVSRGTVFQLASSPGSVIRASKSAREEKNQEDDEDQPADPRWSIAVLVVSPIR